MRYYQVPSGTISFHQVPSGTIRYQWVPVYQVPVYLVYQKDQDQISGATYISDVVFSEPIETFPYTSCEVHTA